MINNESGLPHTFFQRRDLSLDERNFLIAKAHESAKIVAESVQIESNETIRWISMGSMKGLKMYRGEPRTGTTTATSMKDNCHLHSCCKFTVQATLEEVADFYDCSTTEKLKEFCRYFSDLSDGVVLYPLVKPDNESDRMHQINVKWLAQKMPTKFIHDRDFVVLECQDTFTDPITGRKGWVCAQHSIKLPCCEELQDRLNLVRGRLYHSGHVVIESEQKGYCDVFYVVHTNLKGNMKIPAFARSLIIKKRLKSIGALVEAILQRRLGQNFARIEGFDMTTSDIHSICSGPASSDTESHSHISLPSFHHHTRRYPSSFNGSKRSNGSRTPTHSGSCCVCNTRVQGSHGSICRKCKRLACTKCCMERQAMLPSVGLVGLNLCTHCMVAMYNEPIRGRAQSDGLDTSRIKPSITRDNHTDDRLASTDGTPSPPGSMSLELPSDLQMSIADLQNAQSRNHIYEIDGGSLPQWETESGASDNVRESLMVSGLSDAFQAREEKFSNTKGLRASIMHRPKPLEQQFDAYLEEGEEQMEYAQRQSFATHQFETMGQSAVRPSWAISAPKIDEGDRRPLRPLTSQTLEIHTKNMDRQPKMEVSDEEAILAKEKAELRRLQIIWQRQQQKQRQAQSNQQRPQHNHFEQRHFNTGGGFNQSVYQNPNVSNEMNHYTNDVAYSTRPTPYDPSRMSYVAHGMGAQRPSMDEMMYTSDPYGHYMAPPPLPMAMIPPAMQFQIMQAMHTMQMLVAASHNMRSDPKAYNEIQQQLHVLQLQHQQLLMNLQGYWAPNFTPSYYTGPFSSTEPNNTHPTHPFTDETQNGPDSKMQSDASITPSESNILHATSEEQLGNFISETSNNPVENKDQNESLNCDIVVNEKEGLRISIPNSDKGINLEHQRRNTLDAESVCSSQFDDLLSSKMSPTEPSNNSLEYFSREDAHNYIQSLIIEQEAVAERISSQSYGTDLSTSFVSTKQRSSANGKSGYRHSTSHISRPVIDLGLAEFGLDSNYKSLKEDDDDYSRAIIDKNAKETHDSNQLTTHNYEDTTRLDKLSDSCVQVAEEAQIEDAVEVSIDELADDSYSNEKLSEQLAESNYQTDPVSIANVTNSFVITKDSIVPDNSTKQETNEVSHVSEMEVQKEEELNSSETSTDVMKFSSESLDPKSINENNETPPEKYSMSNEDILQTTSPSKIESTDADSTDFASTNPADVYREILALAERQSALDALPHGSADQEKERLAQDLQVLYAKLRTLTVG